MILSHWGLKLEDPDGVERTQLRTCHLLQRYLRLKYGQAESVRLMGNLMQILMLAKENGQIRENALQALLFRQQQHAGGAAAAAATGMHFGMF